MNAPALALSFLLASAAAAQPALPDLETFKELLKQVPAPSAPPARAHFLPDASQTLARAPELLLKERWPRKVATYDILSGGEVLGRITGTADGYELRDAAGTLLAATHDTLVKRGRVIQVTDGAGELLGTIKMGDRPWLGRKSFEVWDETDTLAAQTGTVHYLQHPFTLSHAGGGRAAVFEEKPCLLSRWTVSFAADNAVDRRLILFILPYNEAADQ